MTDRPAGVALAEGSVVWAVMPETDEFEPSPQPALPEVDRPARRRRGVGCLVEIVETVVLTVVIFVVVQTFVAQPFKVEGGSMETTLLPDQYVLVDKLTPRWAPYARGDVIVLDPPAQQGAHGTPFIKRVIGLPGDRVELRDGSVYVNGVALDEPYVFTANGVLQATDPAPGGPTEWLVPDGQLLVMGDHRRNSSDSRAFGPIEISHVLGRAWLRYWPLDTFGTLPTPTYASLGARSVTPARAAELSPRRRRAPERAHPEVRERGAQAATPG